MDYLRYLPQNLTVLFDMILGGLIHADWRRAWQCGGALGWMRELGAALTGLNAWPFFIDARGAWTAGQVAALLHHHGIATWGWGYADGEFFFRVKLRQAHWAQYLLSSSDVPVRGRLLDDASAHPYARGQVGGPAPKPASPGSTTPLQRLDHLLDRISGR